LYSLIDVSSSVITKNYVYQFEIVNTRFNKLVSGAIGSPILWTRKLPSGCTLQNGAQWCFFSIFACLNCIFLLKRIADYREEEFESFKAALCVEDIFFLWKKM